MRCRKGQAQTTGHLNTQSLFSADTSLMGYFNNRFAVANGTTFRIRRILVIQLEMILQIIVCGTSSYNITEVPDIPEMGVALEGTQAVWPDNPDLAVLPEFDVFNRQSRYIEIFNKGKAFFGFNIIAGSPWIRVSQSNGVVEKDIRVWVSIDWENVPEGKNEGVLKISGLGRVVDVKIAAFNPSGISSDSLRGFVEANGYVSMEAAHFAENKPAGENRWIEIEDFGHTLSGMRSIAVTDAPALTPGKDSPCLEYQMYLFSAGSVEVNPYVAPTLNFLPGRAVRYAISFDHEVPQIITLVPEDFDARNGNRDWERSVSDNYRIGKSVHPIADQGYHTLKIWMVDPGVVLQKIVVNTGGVKPSYLGPPNSFFRPEIVVVSIKERPRHSWQGLFT